MVDVNAKVKTQKQAAGRAESRRTRRARTTPIRARCKGERSLEEEAGEQLQKASRQIVQAQVKRAKAGSLTHTKWLCSLAKQLPDGKRQGEAKASLAVLLLEQLGKKS